MPDLETALAILATAIQNAGYSVRIRHEHNAIEASLKHYPVYPYQIEQILEESGIEAILYTTNYGCGNTYIRPVLG